MSRMDKLNQLFKREIGSVILLGEVSDPRLKQVTITFADVSKDLSFAHVGFSVLSDDPKVIQSAQSGLDSACRRIRKIMAGRVELRHIPELRFVYDDSISQGLKMAQKLDVLRQERGEEDSPAEE